jgi:uncharacterized protein (TIGR02145 family)
MKPKLFLLFAIVTVAGILAISGCNRDDDDQSNRRNGRNTGTLNGHEWVDLGLPSGTKWATCNVGANNPEDYGNYFAWGETTTKDVYIESNYKYYKGNSISYFLTKYCNNSSYGYDGYTDTLTILEAIDDAATANWGSGWHMPTKEEMEELFRYCPWVWTTKNRVNGIKFTGTNGNSIFLPAAGNVSDHELFFDGTDGYYWLPLVSTGNAHCGYSFFFSEHSYDIYNESRIIGYPVRPVCTRQ